METKSSPAGRLGLHYFADSLHYRERDLEQWVPQLQSLGVTWLTLWAPEERAIPEYFIQGLVEADIQPILHFLMPIRMQRDPASLRLLLRNYARWGVRYAAFFERPNVRAMWHPAAWAQANLVERFMDIFIPLAEMSAQEGLSAVLPPLEPGGDYWDTIFLREALRSLARRAPKVLEGSLALGAYAWAGELPLEWGAGGLMHWPEPRPYTTKMDAPDHRGFRIFDWYASIAQQEIGKDVPVVALRCGSWPGKGARRNGKVAEEIDHEARNLHMALWILGEETSTKELPPLTANLVACTFWLMASEAGSPHIPQVWFHSPDTPKGFVERLRGYVTARHYAKASHHYHRGMDYHTSAPMAMQEAASHRDDMETIEEEVMTSSQGFDVPLRASQGKDHRLFSHYVLLPQYAWGEPKWNEKILSPLLQKSHPTVGTSLMEACHAERVTIVGGQHTISDQVVEMLKQNGCKVERLLEDGTLLAT